MEIYSAQRFGGGCHEKTIFHATADRSASNKRSFLWAEWALRAKRVFQELKGPPAGKQSMAPFQI